MTWPRRGSWSDSEVALLKSLVPTGLTARQISDRLPGRTRNAVIGMSHRLGMVFPFTRVKRESLGVVRLSPPKVSGTGPRRRRKKLTPPTSNVVPFVDREHRVKSNVDPVRLSELPPNGCRFPIKRGPDGEWCMCADRRTHGFYCEEHFNTCHRPRARAS